LNVTSTEGFDFTAQFEISADRVVAENAVTIHDRQGMTSPFDDVIGLESLIRLVRDSKDNGFAVFERGLKFSLDTNILESILIAEEPAPRVTGRGIIIL
jgi:hypothetical protein